MEAIKKDYESRGVKFYFVYKSLAHPEGGTLGFLQPFTLDERLAHVKKAYKELGNTIPWLCDNMENELKHALGDRPNSEFVIDPKGKIVVMRDWSHPDSLREDLEKLVGKVKNPTHPEDLDLDMDRSASKIRSGVVERPDLPRDLMPVKVEPQPSKSPFYVKLRAEVELSVLRNGTGKLYLGFHLDPIHQVHWNNLAAPLSFEIEAKHAEAFSPASATAPKPKVESDIDPREFLVDCKLLDGESQFKVTVKYFACSDEEGWCKPVTQEYLVSIQADRDAGSTRRSSGRRGSPQRPAARGSQKQLGSRFAVNRLMSRDRNQDGKISATEMPPQLRRMIRRFDLNGDNAIDKQEAEKMLEQMRNRRN